MRCYKNAVKEWKAGERLDAQAAELWHAPSVEQAEGEETQKEGGGDGGCGGFDDGIACRGFQV